MALKINPYHNKTRNSDTKPRTMKIGTNKLVNSDRYNPHHSRQLIAKRRKQEKREGRTRTHFFQFPASLAPLAISPMPFSTPVPTLARPSPTGRPAPPVRPLTVSPRPRVAPPGKGGRGLDLVSPSLRAVWMGEKKTKEGGKEEGSRNAYRLHHRLCW